MRQVNIYNRIRPMIEQNKDMEIKNINLQKEAPEEKKKLFLELISFAFLALAIVLPIRTFIAQPFIVSGNSMFPTFKDGQYLIVDEISYRFHAPARGDVIVFHYPKDPSKFFIKRIVGLPNESISIQDNRVIIKNKENPDGLSIEEPYIQNQASDNIEKTLGDGEYFVLGDNRIASSDSRAWGVLPKKLMVGQVFIRLLPVSEASFLPGDYKNK